MRPTVSSVKKSIGFIGVNVLYNHPLWVPPLMIIEPPICISVGWCKSGRSGNRSCEHRHIYTYLGGLALKMGRKLIAWKGMWGQMKETPFFKG